MLTISESSLAALNQKSASDYAARLLAWVRSRPELANVAGQVDLGWCHQTLQLGQRDGIESEDDVARLARLRLLRGDEWLGSAPAQEVLQSERDGQLKAFQLECLHWGIGNG